MKKILSVGLVLAISTAFAGEWTDNVWYVATNGVDTAAAQGGGTQAAPFRTLQFAHDQAGAGDTVVLTPGAYQEGVSYAVGSNRLTVTKRLYFRSSSGNAADTVILGMKDPDTITAASRAGVGPKAIRCVRLSTGAEGSEFHHITFRGGATRRKTESDPSTTSFTASGAYNGGCISCGATAAFVDCVIEDGSAYMVGGGVVGTGSSTTRSATLIRCLVDNCSGDSWGSAVTYSKLWCSVVANAHNASGLRPAIGFSTLVNSSLAGANETGVDKGCKVYNSVLQTSGVAVTNLGKSASTLYNSYGKTNLVDGVKSFDHAFLAPAVKDFRLFSGTRAVDGGKTSYLTSVITLPAGVLTNDFNGVPIDMTKATCHAGAVQAVATAVGGRITVPAGCLLNGHRNQLASYAYAEQWPNAFRLADPNANFLRFTHGGDYHAELTLFFYPDLTGSAVVVTPPPSRSDEIYKPTSATTTNRLWCAPSADATVADGTEEHPFATLQAAIDFAAERELKVVLIQAKPGDYRTGGGVVRGHNCRVAVPAGLVPIIRSTGGPDVTFITGAADPNPPNADYPGCGPNAVRCFGAESNDSNLMLQGFTLRDGYTACGDPAKPGLGDQGGAVYGSGVTGLQILDCVITNCHGVTAAVAVNGIFNRCRVCDCTSPGSLFTSAYLVSTVVDVSCSGEDGARLGDNTRAYFSTVPGATFDSPSNAASVGSLLGIGTATEVLKECVGSFREPYYANAAAGDLRLMSTTPVVAAYQGLDAADQQRLQDFYCSNVKGAFGGGAYQTVPETSLPFPGAVQEPLVDGAYVGAATGGGFTVDGATSGRGYQTAELPVTLRASASVTRPFVGVSVNGVTNRLVGSSTLTVTADDLAAAGGNLTVLPCYTADWYVDPTGSDANSGFFADDARKTLSVTLEDVRLQSGDTVHLAAGRYDDGVTTVGEGRFRAAVPNGVSLVGAGVGQTFVVGAKDVSAEADANGFGPEAVRGVRLETGASVRNLTITDCWTEKDGNGAGVLAAEPALSDRSDYVVENCFITNCWAASYGGGASGVRLVKSRLIGNRAVKSGGSTYYCELFGSITDWSYQGSGNESSANNMFVTVVGSTLGKANRTFADSGNTAAIGNNTTTGKSSTLKNSIILGAIRVVHQPAVNCIYVSVSMPKYDYLFTNSCRKATVAEIALDADYRPTIGTSVAIDFGSNLVHEAVRPVVGDTDILGTQRIYNGRIDAGAVEADWRETYAKDILPRRFTVDAADPDVLESDGGTVLVPAGASLVGTLVNASQSERAYRLSFTVPAGGHLTLTVGETATEYAEGAHTCDVTCPALGSLSLAFAAQEGTTEILRGQSLVGALLFLR